MSAAAARCCGGREREERRHEATCATNQVGSDGPGRQENFMG